MSFIGYGIAFIILCFSVATFDKEDYKNVGLVLLGTSIFIVIGSTIIYLIKLALT